MKDIKDYLKELGVEFKTYEHPAVYTCEEAKKYTQNIKGVHSKNLFLKSKKSKSFFMVILPADKKLSIKGLESIINEKLTFANEKELKEILGTFAGSVSPFNLINDKENKVKIIIDKKVWGSDYLSFHPNTNTETLDLTKKDFEKFLSSLNKIPNII